MRLTIVDILVLSVVAAALLFKVAVTPASSHEWYPWECCSGLDCARVEKIEQVPEGMRVTTKHGTVLVPTDFKRRQSEDGSFHACMRPEESGGMHLICFFEPSGS